MTSSVRRQKSVHFFFSSPFFLSASIKRVINHKIVGNVFLHFAFCILHFAFCIFQYLVLLYGFDTPRPWDDWFTGCTIVFDYKANTFSGYQSLRRVKKVLLVE